MTSAERILVALDVDSADSALSLARMLAGKVGGFKVGLELVNAEGPDIFARLADAGAGRIFYDAKFHDIPSTVAGAVRAVARHGIWMVNVHCAGGMEMMQAARDAAQSATCLPLVIGVTVLTSIDEGTMNQELHIAGTVAEQVERLALLAQSAGLDGVVASPQELTRIRRACSADFLTVIPGVRPADTALQDQKRVATPARAVQDGADYLVIGRPVTQAGDPVQAVEKIVSEIADAQRNL